MPHADRNIRLAYHKKYNDAHYKEYYRINAVWLRAKTQKWREQNHAKSLAKAKAWKQANPEKVKIIDKNRHHIRRSIIKNHTGVSLKQWNRILDRYDHRCVYCGIHEVIINALGDSITMDHVIPIVRGGRHEPKNIVPACRSCNARKGVGSKMKRVL